MSGGSVASLGHLLAYYVQRPWAGRLKAMARTASKESPSIHPTAEVSAEASVGPRTYIWHQAQVREGARIGADCRLGKGVYVDRNVIIGDNCKLQNYATLYDGVTLGEGVFVGPHAVFTNDLYPRAKSPDWRIVPTVVEDGASIGANATIVCGVRVGRHAMVGAGSVVTKDVPPNALVVGVPARLAGYVCEDGSRLRKGRCPKCGREYRVGARG